MNGIEGNDGRIYYTYGVGTTFEIFKGVESAGKVKVLDCFLDRYERETYLVEIKGLETPFSLSRLEKYLKYGNAHEVEYGTAKEYPLTKDEVMTYYSAKRDERNRARNEAEKYMSATTGYNALVKQLLQQSKLLAEAVVKELDTVPILSERYKETCEKVRNMIVSKGIDIGLFEPEQVCFGCKGKGITPKGDICFCARENAEEIKRWNSLRRLSRRLREDWTEQWTDPFTVIRKPREQQERLSDEEKLQIEEKGA